MNCITNPSINIINESTFFRTGHSNQHQQAGLDGSGSTFPLPLWEALKAMEVNCCCRKTVANH